MMEIVLCGFTVLVCIRLYTFTSSSKRKTYNMDVAYWDKEKLPSGNLSDLA